MTSHTLNSIGNRAIFTLLSVFLVSRVGGAPINYGDFSDIPPGSVMYLDVTETANSPGDKEPLYGPPNISVNTLGFDPTGYRASAAGGVGADLTDGQLNFAAKGENAAITRFAVSAAGDYSLSGFGTAGTSVSYRSSIAQLNILEVDGVPVSSPVVLPGLDVTESFELSGGGTNGAPWGSTITYDVNAALAHAGVAFQFGATKLDFTINNVLNATSEPSSIAQIEANGFALVATTVPVPEPAGMVIVGLGFCGLAMMRTKKQ